MHDNRLGEKFQVAALVICAGALFGEARSAEQISVIEVGRFSTASTGPALPDGWKPLTFKKIPQHTAYEVVADGGIAVVKATSHASASGLINSVSVDPKEYPFMRWRWKVDHVLGNSDVHLKEGDDYPARLYVTFEYDPDKVGLARKLKYKAGKVIFGDIPIAALNYIWDTRSTVGTMVDNAYTDFAKMIVIESGSLKTGKWVEEERNVLEDYQLAFGGDPPKINGVAIMTDTDNTKEEATAYYGDISFAKIKKSSADGN